MSAVPIDTIILYFPNETPVTAFHCDFKRIVRYKKLGEEKKERRDRKIERKKGKEKKTYSGFEPSRLFETTG